MNAAANAGAFFLNTVVGSTPFLATIVLSVVSRVPILGFAEIKSEILTSPLGFISKT